MEGKEGYAPGWDDDAIAMMGSRRAEEHAAFALPYLSGAARVLDIGCGPGTITIGLTRAMAPDGTVIGVDNEPSQVNLAREVSRNAGVTNVRFEQGSAYALPVADSSVDVVFAHAVFEHLASPAKALLEIRRVLRPGGTLALASSDWSGAVLNPWNDDVAQAMRAHHVLRRRAGGDPFAGGRLEGLVRDAGFVAIEVRRVDRLDMTYDELARYVGKRIQSALTSTSIEDHRSELHSAAAAAQRWAAHQGTFIQCWVDLTARSSSPDQ